MRFVVPQGRGDRSVLSVILKFTANAAIPTHLFQSEDRLALSVITTPKPELATPPLPFRERAGVRVQTTQALQESSPIPPPRSPLTHYSRISTLATPVTSATPFFGHHIQPFHHAAHRPARLPDERDSRQNPEYKVRPDAGDET